MTLTAPPQLLDHPCCDVINQVPWGLFLLIHVALFTVTAYFAMRSFDSGSVGVGWAFALFALAEISYMTYHVNVTQFLFAHTISEVFNGLAFVVLFTAVARREVTRYRPAVDVGAKVTR